MFATEQILVQRHHMVVGFAFEDLQLSNRHKSGVAVRFPRMLRWRRDKRAADADRLEHIHAMLAAKPHAPTP